MIHANLYLRQSQCAGILKLHCRVLKYTSVVEWHELCSQITMGGAKQSWKGQNESIEYKTGQNRPRTWKPENPKKPKKDEQYQQQGGSDLCRIRGERNHLQVEETRPPRSGSGEMLSLEVKSGPEAKAKGSRDDLHVSIRIISRVQRQWLFLLSFCHNKAQGYKTLEKNEVGTYHSHPSPTASSQGPRSKGTGKSRETRTGFKPLHWFSGRWRPRGTAFSQFSLETWFLLYFVYMISSCQCQTGLKGFKLAGKDYKCGMWTRSQESAARGEKFK